MPDAAGEYDVVVSFRLREATTWADAGHEVAWGQGVFGAWVPLAQVGVEPPRVVRGVHNTGVHGSRFHVRFSRLHGGLTSYRFGEGAEGGRELLRGVVRPNFWHAPTSNERGWGGPAEDGAWLLASRYAFTPPESLDPVVTVEDDGSVTAVYRYGLPIQPATVCEVAYRVDGTGRVEVTQTMELAEGLPAGTQVAVAKFWASEGAHRAAYAAQHLHGGIGVDVDYPLHRYYLWAKHIELALGSATRQLVRLGAALADA